MITARPGFDAMTWRLVRPFDDRCATPADVEENRAVFALADTFNGRPMEMAKPTPVVWFGEDEEFAALVIQAEAHETEDGETMEVLGLLLPDGDTAVAMLDDVEMVDDTDPSWLSLLDADLEDEDDDELIEADNDDDADDEEAELKSLDIEDDDEGA